MKYNININQLALAETNLDLKESAILDYLYYLCSSTNSKIQENRVGGWTWVSFGTLLKQMPLLRIKSRGALRPRFEAIRDAGFIEFKVDENQKFLVKLTEKVEELFIKMNGIDENRSRKRTVPFTKMNSTVHENEPIIILDNYTNNNKSISKDIEKLSEQLPEELGKSYLHRLTKVYALFWKDKFGTDFKILNWAKQAKIFKSLLKNYTEYQVSAMIGLHFEWRGINGDDEFTYKKLEQAGFPIEWLPKATNAYWTYLTNNWECDVNDKQKLKESVDKLLKSLN